VAVFTAEPAVRGDAATHARHLLWPFHETPVVKHGPPLDALFYLQLDLLRAFFVVMFSVIALLCGLCCMMAVRPMPKSVEHVANRTNSISRGDRSHPPISLSDSSPCRGVTRTQALPLPETESGAGGLTREAETPRRGMLTRPLPPRVRSS
jgi:hypothetical protein